MQARMSNPAIIVPDAMQALLALGTATKQGGVPSQTLELVHLRASQINGCSACVDMHPRLAKKAGETDERLFAVVAWREAPYFTDAERAALALTEAVTRLSDRADPVPDEIWDEAAVPRYSSTGASGHSARRASALLDCLRTRTDEGLERGGKPRWRMVGRNVRKPIHP